LYFKIAKLLFSYATFTTTNDIANVSRCKTDKSKMVRRYTVESEQIGTVDCENYSCKHTSHEGHVLNMNITHSHAHHYTTL